MPRLPTVVSAGLFFVLFIFSSNLASDEIQQNESIVLPGGRIHLSGAIAPPDVMEGGLLILKFAGELSEEQEAQLSARGVVLQKYIGNHAYWTRITRTASLPGTVAVTAVVQPEFSFKIAPEVMRAARDCRGDGEITVTVSLLSDRYIVEFSEQLEGIGGRMEGPGLLYGDRLEVSLPVSALEKLAASDAVIVVEPRLKRKRLFNSRAAHCSNIDDTRERFGLDGTGVAIGIWDGGKVYEHREFAGRLVNIRNGYIDAHSTHVAGTIGASGINGQAGGMAPNSILYAYRYNGDLPKEMATARKKYGVILSNNSWGYSSGWELEDGWSWYGTEGFGLYSSESSAYDKLVHETGLIVVFAAGNDRRDRGTGGKYYDVESRSVKNQPGHAPDGPYHSLGELASAKNIIAVGAVKANGQMSNFSSWGPTDDGRIKPEITADGVSLYSTLPYERYGVKSGTSMSASATTGGLALVVQQWRELLGTEITPDAVRALLAATAEDRGNKGPDYQYGFGVLDVQAMVELIEQSIDNGAIRQGTVAKGDRTDSYELIVPAGVKNIRAALAWIDPPAVPRAAKALVNDLDLKLVSPSGTIYRPWRLDGSNPAAPATQGINKVDNIELVEIRNPEAGVWLVGVSAANFGSGNKQRYTVVANGTKSVSLR